VLGKRHVADIDLDDVLAVLDPIWEMKNETAKRLQGRVQAVLDYAKVRKWRSGDNPARWRGTLDQVLAAPGDVQGGRPL
jgi:hypothetical protein